MLQKKHTISGVQLHKKKLSTILSTAIRQNESKAIIRKLECLLYYTENQCVTKTCEEYDISRMTFYRWAHQYDAKNISTLDDKRTTASKVVPNNSILENLTTAQLLWYWWANVHNRIATFFAVFLLLGVIAALQFMFRISTADASSWDPTLLVNSEAFQIIDDGDGNEDIELHFGDNAGELLSWSGSLSTFLFSDDVSIQGNIAGSGSVTINSDQAGDAELIFGNNLTNQTISIAENANAFAFSSGATFAGTLSGASLTLSALANCDSIDTNAAGQLVCGVDAGGNSTLAPFIENGGGRVDPSGTATFTFNGNHFDYGTAVSIPGWEGTIDDVRYNSATQIEVDVTAGATETDYDVVFTNNVKDSTGFEVDNGVDAITVATSTWSDLRLGGDAFTTGTTAGNDIRHRAGMTVGRDANGMFFTGLNPWTSWVKFESLQWVRGTNQTLQWIFNNPDAAMMIGMSSTLSNEASNSQWQEGEVMSYFNTSTNHWGFYGSNGAGSWGNQANGVAIAAGNTFKLKIEDDGDLGDTITLYQLPSAAPGDWDDESTVVFTATIAGTLNPNDALVMPFIIPRSGGAQRFIAVKVE